MKVLIVTKYYHPIIGGVETLVKTISERYVTLGHECTVLCMDPEKDSDEIIAGVRVVRFKRQGISRTGAVPGIWRWMVENDVRGNFDIVNVHNYHSLLALEAAFFCHTRKVPYVLTSHYHGRGHTSLRNVLFRIYGVLGKHMLEWSERIICVSAFEKGLVERDFEVPPGKYAIVPNGGKDYPQLYMPRETGAVLFVGRLMEYKGVDILLHSLKLLKEEEIVFHLRVVGSGPEKDELHLLAKQLGIETDVDWMEDVTELQLNTEYRRANVLVLLSSAEAYGLVVAEALMCGTPCIVAKTSALTEFAQEPGCFGVEFPPEPRKVAEMIKMIFAGEIKVGPFSDKLITWQQVTERYLEIYQGAIDHFDR